MDDPGTGPKAMVPDPEVIGEEPSVIERAPAENPAMANPPESSLDSADSEDVGVAEPTPEEETAAMREPDVFDLHSGKDPLRPAIE